jgi:hypothetical protein
VVSTAESAPEIDQFIEEFLDLLGGDHVVMIFVSSAFMPKEKMSAGLRALANHQPMTPIIQTTESRISDTSHDGHDDNTRYSKIAVLCGTHIYNAAECL